MTRLAVMLVLLLLPLVAFAEGGKAAQPPTMMTEPLSRAQVVQMIEDRGYFMMDGLHHGADGSWRCTALSGPGKRVAVTMDKNGNITEQDLPQNGQD